MGPVFWLALIGVFALTNLLIELNIGSPTFNGEQRGPDGYMRLLRVTQLYETGAWFDHVIPRSNAPYGEVLHWTRPADLVFLAGALALEPFLGFERALFWWGAFVAPLLHIALVAASLWAVAPWFGGDRRLLLALALLTQAALWPHGLLGRTDHHMLILLTFVVTLGFSLRAMTATPGTQRRAHWSAGLAAGLAAGFGLWLSVEFLAVLAVQLAALTLAWLGRGDGGQAGIQARRNLHHAVGLSLVVLLALLVERPPGQWWTEAYDRISLAHLLVGLLAAGFWGAVLGLGGFLLSPGRRALFAGLGAATAGTVLLLVFPKFFGGPEVDYDPGLRPIFLDLVTEVQPLVPHDGRNAGWLALYLGSALFALPHLLYRLWRCWKRPADDPDQSWPLWLLIALGLLAYLPLAIAMRRFTGFPAILLAILVADLLGGLLAGWQGETRVRRLAVLLVAVPAVFFTPLALGGGLLRAYEAKGGLDVMGTTSCLIDPLIRELTRPEGLGRAPLTVLASVNFGPRLMYDTPHRVITTPYPRNAAGQLDAFRIYKATDLEEARRLVTARRIDLIVVCRHRPMYGGLSGGDETLDSRLRRGAPPDWLSPMALGEAAAADFAVFRAQHEE